MADSFLSTTFRFTFMNITKLLFLVIMKPKKTKKSVKKHNEIIDLIYNNKESGDQTNKRSFYVNVLASDIKINLPEKVKKLCDEVFKNNIDTTLDLLLMATKLFYKDFKINELYFVPRILQEVNLFMEKFCTNLNEETDVKKKHAIFLLLLRTNFHIWNMENLFEGNEQMQPKSFIIMSNQSLFSSNPNPKNWILFCFSSINESIIWDTSSLKVSIEGEISDSNFLENDFFNVLKNNKNIEIYSNNLNYINHQAYFFHIIRTFFYVNNKAESDYCRKTDGVILNSFRQWDVFEKDIENCIPSIKVGKSSYESKCHNVNYKWDFVLELIHQALTRQEKVKERPIEVVDELTNDETVQAISRITLTMTIVKRFIIMIIRIILKQPLIFEGSTGVGKSLSVQLLKYLITINSVENDDGFKWSYHQLDCHGALQFNDLKKEFSQASSSKKEGRNQVFFFDELNTSPVSSYIINQMNNYYLKKIENKDIISSQSDLLKSNVFT